MSKRRCWQREGAAGRAPTQTTVKCKMRQGQGSKRSRNRGGNRRGGGRQQSLDSNGPSVRVRGSAQQIHEKYLTLARDASSSGDRVSAENYSQHAEHYHRVLAVEAEQREQRNNQQTGRHQRPNGRDNDVAKTEAPVKVEAKAMADSSAETSVAIELNDGAVEDEKPIRPIKKATKFKKTDDTLKNPEEDVGSIEKPRSAAAD